MTPAMQRELDTTVAEERAERGLISARCYALGCMIQKRRDALSEMVTWLQPYHEPTMDTIRDTVRINAELTLLMIERGA